MGCCGGGSGREMRYGHHGQHGYHSEAPRMLEHPGHNPTPMELLKERLARGEITIDEYERISQALSS